MSYVDGYIYGKPCYDWVWPGVYERTKEEYPYAYSAHYIKGNAQTAKDCNGEYSDRLLQHNYDKYRECTARVFPERKGSDYFWRSATMEQCSRWASLYFGKPMRVCAVAEECHQGNGYPLWIIWVKEA